MNVAELKKELENYPDDMDVFFEKGDGFELVNNISESELFIEERSSYHVEFKSKIAVIIQAS